MSSRSTSSAPIESDTTTPAQPPPEWMQPAESSEADAARKRIRHAESSYNGWSPFNLFRQRHQPHGTQPVRSASGLHEPPMRPTPEPQQSAASTSTLRRPIDMEDVVWQDDETKDLYRWAILYENQRGGIVFSTPHYSSLSLLPFDPPAFTTPSSAGSSSISAISSGSPNKNNQPTLSIAEYSLPDGSWKWVSKSWMIDMQEDGSVSHDGFEYNWYFRRSKWRTRVGHMSWGGYVRRRRWVRLMVRPALSMRDGETDDSITVDNGSSVGHGRIPKSDSISKGGLGDEDMEPEDIWTGDEGDWSRCAQAMKRAGRDGAILDLWRNWVELGQERRKAVAKDTSTNQQRSDLSPSPFDDSNQPNILKHIAVVLKSYHNDILNYFFFPVSRVAFLRLVTENFNDLLQEDKELQADYSNVDFWSELQTLRPDPVIMIS